MRVIIESVTNDEDKTAMLRIRRQVFEREMSLALPNALDLSNAMHLLARAGPSGEEGLYGNRG